METDDVGVALPSLTSETGERTTAGSSSKSSTTQLNSEDFGPESSAESDKNHLSPRSGGDNENEHLTQLDESNGDIIHTKESEFGPEGSIQAYFQTPMKTLLIQRVPWLIGLLLLQSLSAVILHGAEKMLSVNMVVVTFLPMLVGTGGNAGNQPGVMITRAIAGPGGHSLPMKRIYKREFILAMITGIIMFFVSLARVAIEYPHDIKQALVISLSMGMVVMVAIILGITFSYAFSYGLERLHLDPASGSAPLLTTVSDLIGICVITIFAVTLLSHHGSAAHEPAQQCPVCPVCPGSAN
eukprot:g75835.t1